MNAPVRSAERHQALDRLKVEDALESVRDAARFLDALNAMGSSATGSVQMLTLHDVLALIGPAATMLNASLRELSTLLEQGKGTP